MTIPKGRTMKTLIIIAAIFLATTCWADMPAELFKMTNTIDITSIKKDNHDNDIFGMTPNSKEFMVGAKEFFMMQDSFFLLKDWVIVAETTYCCAVTNLKSVFAVCIDDKIVVIKEVK